MISPQPMMCDSGKKGSVVMDRVKIMVVDDESRMRKLVRDFLVKSGYDVLEAGDGAWAIKWRKQSNENPMPHGMGYKMEEAK